MIIDSGRGITHWPFVRVSFLHHISWGAGLPQTLRVCGIIRASSCPFLAFDDCSNLLCFFPEIQFLLPCVMHVFKVSLMSLLEIYWDFGMFCENEVCISDESAVSMYEVILIFGLHFQQHNMLATILLCLFRWENSIHSKNGISEFCVHGNSRSVSFGHTRIIYAKIMGIRLDMQAATNIILVWIWLTTFLCTEFHVCVASSHKPDIQQYGSSNF